MILWLSDVLSCCALYPRMRVRNPHNNWYHTVLPLRHHSGSIGARRCIIYCNISWSMLVGGSGGEGVNGRDSVVDDVIDGVVDGLMMDNNC